jgi:metal-responsive CopG/Arc/MetJ family transcriptional regulator
MPKKGITKARISITLDNELVELLNKECNDRTMKVSSYIEKLIRTGHEHEKKKK